MTDDVAKLTQEAAEEAKSIERNQNDVLSGTQLQLVFTRHFSPALTAKDAEIAELREKSYYWEQNSKASWAALDMHKRGHMTWKQRAEAAEAEARALRERVERAGAQIDAEARRDVDRHDPRTAYETAMYATRLIAAALTPPAQGEAKCPNQL